jgi:iron-sulfur cluster repair protein YtfE (RIC family)
VITTRNEADLAWRAGRKPGQIKRRRHVNTATPQMDRPKTATLRAEHERLLDHVEHIRVAALELPALSGEERRELVDRIISLLRNDLAAHAESEKRGLYPYLGRLLGDPQATAPMAYDHDAIARLTTRLTQAGVHDVPLLQELLYSLHALINLHFRKEEDLYLPLLERQPAEHVQHVLGAMREIRFEHGYPTKTDL